MNDIQAYSTSEIKAIDNNEERLITDAISTLKSMGMMEKYDEDQQRGFIRSCMAYKLNPILKEIYPMPFYNSETKKYNLGVCPDYKSFLNRAELSGVWDGYEVNFNGEVKFKTVEKEIKKKDGGTFKKSVKAIDPMSSLSGTITIWRKDWSRPFKSRPLFLVHVMKDTDFWHGDPYGMLEKQLIRTFFPKAFPKDCAMRDDSIEMEHQSAPEPAEYEVIDTKPVVDKGELALALKEARETLYSVPMVSTETNTWKESIDTMFKAGDIAGIRNAQDALRERLEAAQEAKKAEVEESRPGVESPEMKAKSAILKVLRELIAKGRSSVYIRNSLKKHLNIEAEKDEDWEALLWKAPFDRDVYAAAWEHWNEDLKATPSKLRKEAIKLAKASEPEDEREALLEQIENTPEEGLADIIDLLKENQQ